MWLYLPPSALPFGLRFPLSLRMVEEMLAFRGIEVSYETIRQWGPKFGQEFANLVRRRLPRPGDKWHLDEGVARTHWQDVGAEISVWAHFAPSRGVQATRQDTGMPSPVMMLITLQAPLASVFCVGRVRAWRLRPIRVL